MLGSVASFTQSPHKTAIAHATWRLTIQCQDLVGSLGGNQLFCQDSEAIPVALHLAGRSSIGDYFACAAALEPVQSRMPC